MMRTWTQRAFVALITVALTASGMRAAPPEGPPSVSDDKETQILLQLQTLTSKVNALQASQDAQVKSIQDDVARLKDQMRDLQEEVRRLSAAPPIPNIAASINPVVPVVPVTPLVTGNIVLENRYSSPASFVVNGRTYRVNPFERATVPAAVGPFTYAVYTDDFGLVQGLTNRYLTPGRDFPITVHP